MQEAVDIPSLADILQAEDRPDREDREVEAAVPAGPQEQALEAEESHPSFFAGNIRNQPKPC